MKIEVESKYDVGDELFYVDFDLTIKKRIVKSINFIQESEGSGIQYRFENGYCDTERYMKYYCKSLDEAAKLAAERAIERFKNKEEC